MGEKDKENMVWRYYLRKKRAEKFYKAVKEGKMGIICPNYKGYNWDE